MPSVTPFWQFLDARPRPEAVLSEWRARLGSCFELIRPLLQATGKAADSYPNPRPHGLPLRVVRHRDGSVVAVCTEGEGTRIELTSSDMAVFALDFRRLRTALAQALGLATSRASLEGRLSVLPIGQWEPKPGAAFPAILVRVTSVRQAREFIHPLVTTASKPTLVLTPTRNHWPDGVQAFCERYKCVVAPLDEIITADGTTLVASDRWRDYLQAFCRQAELKLASNYQNRKPMPMRAKRAASIEKLEKEMEAHLLAARDHAHSLIDRGLKPALLPRPEQKELAKRTGLTTSDVSRCLNDPRAKLLKLLWDMADSLEAVMKYERRR